MKFIKKVAALCFCAALALSVMAITAMAQEPVFTLVLEKTSTGITDADVDDENALELHLASPSSVTYDIKLKATMTNQYVSAISFKIAEVPGLSTPTVKLYQAYDDTKPEQAALTTTYEDGIIYSYTAEGATNNSKDLSLQNADTLYKIGTVTFTVASETNSNPNPSNHQTVNPQLTDINLYVRKDGQYNANAYTVDSITNIKFQINPVYTITLNRFKKNLTTTGDVTTGDGVKTEFTNSEYTDTEVRTLYYDFDQNFYATYDSTTYATTEGALDIPRNLAGYTKDGWIVKTAGNGVTWDVSDTPIVATTDLPAATFPNGVGDKVGNVTLEAKYTPIVYNYNFVWGDGGTTNDTQGTYTIESVKSAENNTIAATLTPAAITFTLPTPTWVGYTFMGWKATQNTTAGHTGYNNDVWTAYDDTDYDADSDNNEKMITNANEYLGKNAYGDVTLTAVWDETGVFASTTYAYANSADALMLFAVPTGDGYSDTDTYKFNDGAMFLVDERYEGAFTNDGASTLDSDKTYAFYAYLAASNLAQKGKVTIVKAASGATQKGNTEILYDGDVYRDSAINTADYGNVDALLAASGGTVQASALNITQMQARLEADVVKQGDATSYGGDTATVPEETSYGSIWDIKAIISMLT